MLAQYFVHKFNAEFEKNIGAISPEAQQRLAHYAWPGNVRELQGAIKRALILAGEVILAEHLPPEVAGRRDSQMVPFLVRDPGDEIRPIKEVSREVVARVEREMISKALSRTQGNKIKTARQLGIDYKTLFNKLKQYGLEGYGRENGKVPAQESIR
jgi:DNA-binding NtrC family response regulator